MKNLKYAKIAAIFFLITVLIILIFIMCGCQKTTTEKYAHHALAEQAEDLNIEKPTNEVFEENRDAGTKGTRITIYTAETSTVPLPSNAEKIYGCTSMQEQLLLLYMSNGALFAAKYTENGEFLSEHLLFDNVIHVYRAAETHSGNLVICLAGRKENNVNTEAERILVVYNKDFVEQYRCPVPAQCRMSFGPAITPNGDYIFWDVNALYTVTEAGELKNQVAVSDVELVSVVCSDRHCTAVVMSGQTLGVCPVDMETLELGCFNALGTSPACYSYLDGNSGTILVNTYDSLYRYDLDKQAYTKIVDWNSVETNGMEITNISNISQGRIAWTDGTTTKISAIKSEEIERDIITVAAVGARNARLEALATEFNHSNEQYYATVNYYNDSATLITEMIAGEVPDIIELTSVPITVTEQNFADLLPYIDGDPELHQEDFLPSVLSAMLVKEQLLAIPSSFYFQTLVGREHNVGSYENWTVEDLNDLLNAKGAAYSAFPAWMTSKELMLWVANVSLGEFVDWSRLDCNFDSNAFISLLNFCNELPPEFDHSTYASDYEDNVLLTVQMFQSAAWLKTIKRNYEGADISYVGFPGDGTNNGSLFSRSDRDLLLAIPLGAKNKDAAWEFIRLMLMPEWQETAMGLPIRMDALKSQLEALKNDPDKLITEEDIEQFLDTLLKTELYICSDSTISEIVLEEAIPFFMGEKGAKEAAKLIDSRVSLYLAEQE